MKNMHKIRERNLEQILGEEGLVAQDIMESLREEREASGEHLISLVLKNEYVTEQELAMAVVKSYQLPFIYPEDYHIDKEVKEILPTTFCHTNLIYPMDTFGNMLVMVSSGNIQESIIRDIESQTKKDVVLFVAQHGAVQKVLEESFPMDEIATELNSRMDELFGMS
jgi:hypothetical protein